MSLRPRASALIGVICTLIIGPLASQSDSLPAEARRRLDHLVGSWRFQTEYLDSSGKTVRTVSAVDTVRYVLDGRVAEMVSRVPELQLHSRGWWFYNPAQGSFNLVSLNRDGGVWQLSGGLDRFVITSDPRLQKDGSKVVIRFTHYDIEPAAYFTASTARTT